MPQHFSGRHVQAQRLVPPAATTGPPFRRLAPLALVPLLFLAVGIVLGLTAPLGKRREAKAALKMPNPKAGTSTA